MLTDFDCKHAKCPTGKARVRLFDAEGLYLEARGKGMRTPNGTRLWRWKYRFRGVEQVMALGSYPSVSLAAARLARDEAKLLKAKGIDPMTLRRQEKLKSKTQAGSSFKEVALEWFNKQRPTWSDGHATRAKRQLDRDLFPYIGSRPLDEIRPPELLSALHKVEQRGALETASRGLLLARQVWFRNRVGWARTYLKKAGPIEAPKRATFRITSRGQEG